MKVCAVIDTNVIVSALITKNSQSPPCMVLREVLDGRITPLFHDDIIDEYAEVLNRPKFHLKAETIQTMINSIISNGIKVDPKPTGEILVDMDDLIFYEVAMEKRDNNAYVVTGNKKHYPIKDFIVTPSEMMNILNETE